MLLRGWVMPRLKYLRPSARGSETGDNRRWIGLGVSKVKKGTFSVVKAVKSNARDRVGSPPPERVIPDPKQKLAAKPKHKETLADLLEKRERD